MLLTGGVSAAQWQVRYAHVRDQRPEWTAAGRIPAWKITQRNGEVTWQDDANGDCRGRLLFARPLDTAAAKSTVVAVEVTLEYRTSCELSEPHMKRSGSMDVAVIPRADWQAFATTPEQARILDDTADTTAGASCRVKSQGDDVIEWTKQATLRIGLPGSLRKRGDLMLVVSWAAYHFGTAEEGGFRNVESKLVTEQMQRWEFWHALDLACPDLAAVKAAVDARDHAAATAALAAHFRSRTTPVVANPVGAATSAGARKRADETVAHTYRLVGCPPYTFEGDIVWNADPFNYNQWPVALNRHSEWRTLAAVHLGTGEAKYAREWEAQLLHWVEAMPTFIAPRWVEGPYNAPGKTSLSLDAGIRMGQNWFPTFEHFRTVPEISDRALVVFAQSCLRHARYLMKPENFREGSNWGAMESNGLYHIGAMLPEFRDAALWRETAAARQFAELRNQVYPDGAQKELAPGYHGVSLRSFLGVLRLAKRNGCALPDGYVERLERMFEYYVRIAMPNRRVPDINDSGSGHIGGIMRQGAELFPQRRDFTWAGSNGAEGAPPDYDCIVMPYAGWVCMRSDWSAEANYLLFDAGPFGTGHQHEDKLGIVIHAFGRPLLAECGKYAYDTSRWRRYCLSTRGHNTVRVDGMDQNCRGVRAEYEVSQPNTYGFINNGNYCYARDTYAVGYGPGRDRNVTHRRRVLFVKPAFWIVVDDFAAVDGKEHAAEAQFLLDADSAETDADTLAAAGVGGGRGRLAVVPLNTNGLALRVAQGETEPEVRGFLPEGFEKLRPAPALLYTRRFTDTATVAYALVPFEGDRIPARVTGNTLHVRDSAYTVDITPARLSVAGPDHTFHTDGAAWNNVASWVYQLCDYTDDRLDEIAGASFDLAVIDLSRDGGSDFFTAAEIAAVRNSGKIVPQNCPELYTWSYWNPKPNRKYINAIDGLGLESVFYMAHDRPANKRWCKENRDNALAIKEAGKLVLGVDYAREPNTIAEAYRKQKALGFVPYVAEEALDRIQAVRGE